MDSPKGPLSFLYVLGVGLLSGQFRRGQTPPEGTFWAGKQSRFDAVMTEQIDNIVKALIEIGADHNKTPGQVAIAWIIDHPEITSAMVGPDLPEHVDDAFGALDWDLPMEARERLDALSEPEMPRHFDRG